MKAAGKGSKLAAVTSPANDTAIFPDYDRIQLASRLIDRAYELGRALENMQTAAFDDPHENDPAMLYGIAARELGCRIRALTAAASLTLNDKVYDTGTAWEVLHG
jgi:hypothetical protein